MTTMLWIFNQYRPSILSTLRNQSIRNDRIEHWSSGRSRNGEELIRRNRLKKELTNRDACNKVKYQQSLGQGSKYERYNSKWEVHRLKFENQMPLITFTGNKNCNALILKSNMEDYNLMIPLTSHRELGTNCLFLVFGQDICWLHGVACANFDMRFRICRD